MKVKVKKTRGVTGNQHNYGLVSGSIWNYEDKPTTNTVSTTLKPVPRDQANIEAEKNETVVYPDKDGMISHSKIGGKRHAQGGTPLNVPDGSFVFSDFRGMNIKNKELLKNIFNMNTNKAVTPADIAKRYEINEYKKVLQDPWADPMDKKTAQLMIENNMRKLGQLALIQEGMKGFPDGIPDIALPLMGSDIAQAQQTPQQQQPQQPQEQPQEQPQAQKGKQVRPSTMTQAQADLYRTMLRDKAIAEGKGKMTQGEWQNMYKPGNQGEIKITDEPGWFDNAMLAATNPFATLMSTGDRSGNSWQSYVKEHNNNPIDFALNGALAAYTALPGAFAKAPALLRSASQLKNMNNMRNMAGLYEMLGMDHSPIWNPTVKQTGGLTRAQNGVQIPGIVTNPVDSTKLVVNGAPQSGPNPVWDFVKNNKTFVVPATFETAYWAAKKASPTVKGWAEKLSKLPFKEKLGKVAGLLKKGFVDTIGGRIAIYGGLNYALKYFFDDATEEEKAEAAKTLEQVAAETKAKQDSITGNNVYSGAGNNIYLNNPTQRSVVLDTPTVVTKDTTPIVTAPAKVTNSTNLQKNKSSNSSGSTSSQSSNNSGAYVVKGDPTKYSGTYNRSKDSIVIKKQIGGSIRRYQGGGGFDVERAEGAKKADEKGFYMKRPGYFDYTTEVGSQNPSTGDYVRQDGVILPAVKDKSGNKIPTPWNYTDPKTGQTTTYKGVDDIVSFADPYINFKNYRAGEARAGEAIGEDEMGVDAWKKDLASTDDAIRRRAGDFYVSKLNEYNANILGDPTYETIVTKDDKGNEKKGYWEIGTNNAQQGFFEPYVKEEIEEKDKDKDKDKDFDSGKAEKPVYEQGVVGAPWWNYDVVNYANQLGNYFDIEPGNLPVFQQYSPYSPDPTFLDPARAIAQQQGLVRQAGDSIMSGSDPSVGRANVIAAAANSANPIADIMSKYDQANVGIANEYSRNAAQTMNQAMLQNNQYNKQYTDELEVRRQQYQNALREGRTDVAKSVMQGMKNSGETSWMNATSDSYSVDPRTGQVYFKRGFDPKTGQYRSSGSTERDTDYIDYLVNKKGWDRTDAIKYVTGKKTKKGDDNEAQLGGMLYNPMDVIWNY